MTTEPLKENIGNLNLFTHVLFSVTQFLKAKKIVQIEVNDDHTWPTLFVKNGLCFKLK